jgi:hypothetical protein
MSLKRTLLNLGTLVRMRPLVANTALGIHCDICRKPVDYEGIVEARPGESPTVKLLVRCHGAEDLQVLDLGSAHWTPEEFQSMKNRLVVFKPDQGERTFSARVVRDDPVQSHPLVKLASERHAEEKLGPPNSAIPGAGRSDP